MTFSTHLDTLNWDEICLSIYGKTDHDVKIALTKDKPDMNDLMALLSPAASQYLEAMAVKAQKITRQRFGNTVGLFIPMYLSNLCANECTYCGFSLSNPMTRKTLTHDEIVAECQTINRLGFSQVLLVTGEYPSQVGMPYFKTHIKTVREHVSSLLMEVQPLSTDDYAQLKSWGLDGVMLYQETYHKPSYAYHHLKGKKRNFNWRLDAPDRIGQAKIDKIGLGVLVGLSDNFRTDCYMMAEHLRYLQKIHWQSRFSVAVPRLRPCAGGISPHCTMSDKELVQVLCALRLFAPEVDIVLSTRESPTFRDHVIPLMVTQMSAYSQTKPGGYSAADNQTADDTLEQFSIDDDRHPKAVVRKLTEQGLQPIWKDWDSYLGRE